MSIQGRFSPANERREYYCQEGQVCGNFDYAQGIRKFRGLIKSESVKTTEEIENSKQ